jgi:fructokinase
VFLVVGESIVDLIGRKDQRRWPWQFSACPGGSPLNVAVAVARLGHPVRLGSEIDDDLFGEPLKRHLQENQVNLDDVQAGSSTSVAFADVDAQGVAKFDIRLSWQWKSAGVELDGVRCLHVGSLACTVPPGRDDVVTLMQAARAAGIPVSYDPNVRPLLMPDRLLAQRQIEECVDLADIVKVSHDDLQYLYPDRSDEDVAQEWAIKRSCRVVVVTRGADGAFAMAADGTRVATPAFQVDLVDTVGAGDTFMAAMLGSLMEHDALDTVPEGAVLATVLRFAATAAGLSCGREGADPPDTTAVRAALGSLAGAAS